MFSKARLKLTAWYLLIIMVISMLFSVAFYNLATREINRLVKIQEERLQLGNRLIIAPPPKSGNFTYRVFSIKDLEEAAARLRIILVLINGVIIIAAGGAAYFLAGITLKPIAQMVEEQNRFISDASHEMRTPLTSLRSEIEVALRDKKLTQEQARKILESNLEEVVSLQVLSNNLLELSQKGKPSNLNFENVSIKHALNMAIKKLNGSIAKKKIIIEQKVIDSTIRGASERLTELFVILIDNAVKYSPEKSKITILAKKLDGHAQIEIKDSGMGIAKEDLPHVWDRFWRSDKSRGKTSGYGLGLAIAKDIVDSHNGSISIKSTPGKGTTVAVELQS